MRRAVYVTIALAVACILAWQAGVFRNDDEELPAPPLPTADMLRSLDRFKSVAFEDTANVLGGGRWRFIATREQPWGTYDYPIAWFKQVGVERPLVVSLPVTAEDVGFLLAVIREKVTSLEDWKTQMSQYLLAYIKKMREGSR